MTHSVIRCVLFAMPNSWHSARGHILLPLLGARDHILLPLLGARDQILLPYSVKLSKWLRCELVTIYGYAAVKIKYPSISTIFSISAHYCWNSPAANLCAYRLCTRGHEGDYLLLTSRQNITPVSMGENCWFAATGCYFLSSVRYFLSRIFSVYADFYWVYGTYTMHLFRKSNFYLGKLPCLLYWRHKP